jgi:hypothetical protein
MGKTLASKAPWGEDPPSTKENPTKCKTGKAKTHKKKNPQEESGSTSQESRWK